MRKKDYELIAESLLQARAIVGNGANYTWLVDIFTAQLEETQPKFDRQKFLTACGIETEHVHDWKVFKNGWKCNGCKETLDTNEHDTVQD